MSDEDNRVGRRNVLVALDHYEAKSGTPSYKSTPVLLQVRENHEVLRRLVETADD